MSIAALASLSFNYSAEALHEEWNSSQLCSQRWCGTMTNSDYAVALWHGSHETTWILQKLVCFNQMWQIVGTLMWNLLSKTCNRPIALFLVIKIQKNAITNFVSVIWVSQVTTTINNYYEFSITSFSPKLVIWVRVRTWTSSWKKFVLCDGRWKATHYKKLHHSFFA